MIRIPGYFLLLAVAAAGIGPVAPQPDGKPNAAQLSLAAEILEVTKTKARMNDMADMMVPPVMGLVRELNPKADSQILTVFQAAFRNELQAETGSLMTEMAGSYARHLSEADMRAVLAFDKSPAGQRLPQEMPAIGKENVRLGQARGREARLRAAEKAAAQFRDKGLKI